MAREPVAIDFVGVGGKAGSGGGGGGMPTTSRLVKPVATSSSSESRAYQQHGASAASAVQGSSSNFRNQSKNASPFAHPAGLSQQQPPPWINKHAMAMRQLQSQSSGLTTGEVVADVVRHDPQQQQQRESNHNQTVNRFGVFAQQLAQQARKVASMYTNPPPQQQRSVVSMRAPSSIENRASVSGAEPSSHVSSSTQTTAFGSPVPFYSTMKPQSEEVNMVPAHAFERLPVSGGKQPQMAQLTIFYAGTVNVYDKVPIDKAQAIMLLAGQGTSMFSHADSQPPTQSKVSQTSQETTITSVGTPSATTTISNRPAPTTTGVELPQARKASLARFLERRKDSRVRKGPYTTRNPDLAGAQEANRMRSNMSTPSSPNPIGGASLSGVACEPHSPSPPREQQSVSQERVLLSSTPSPTTSSGGNNR